MQDAVQEETTVYGPISIIMGYSPKIKTHILKKFHPFHNRVFYSLYLWPNEDPFASEFNPKNVSACIPNTHLIHIVIDRQ